MKRSVVVAVLLMIASQAQARGHHQSMLESAYAAVDVASISSTAPFVAGFSPGRLGQHKAVDVVVAAINHAQSSLRIALYGFTSKPIALALVKAKQRGVDVEIVCDKKANSGKYTATTYVAHQGIPVRLNGNYAIHHHKFAVIDGKSLILGSFNWTQSAAERNAEDVLLIHNQPELAETFTKEWQTLWDEATPMDTGGW